MGYDAVVVGSGPNGLAAAITLARAGRSVKLIEGKATFGGGMRTAELTLPGFRHDICSAIHPFGMASPFFRSLSLERHGLRWVHPEFPLAHPLDGGRSAVVCRSLDETVARLGADGANYRRLFGPVVKLWPLAEPALLAPVLRPPTHPLAVARIGLPSLLPVTWMSRLLFRDALGPALLAGLGGHSLLPMSALASSAIALVLGALAHRVGWPMPAGGTQSLADALVDHLQSLGGEVEAGRMVTSLDELPDARAVLLNVSTEGALGLLGSRLPSSIAGALRRHPRGPGIFKVDYALDGPIPWTSPECAGAGTIHLGGRLEEIALSEAEVAAGRIPAKPYVLLAQQSRFDALRAPAGKETAWAYCHVPNGSQVDMTEAITGQIERFAPGFKDLILAQASMNCSDFERHNPNYLGGDILGGSNALWNVIARPRLAPDPYHLGDRYYLCSAATPPGGGVHGMGGYHAARSALVRSLL